MTCPSCHNNEAQTSIYGLMPCKDCQSRQAKNSVGTPVEFTTDEIKEERKKYAKDILQPFRHGELSREYVEAWGTSRLNVTEEEIAKAKPVWGDLGFYES